MFCSVDFCSKDSFLATSGRILLWPHRYLPQLQGLMMQTVLVPPEYGRGLERATNGETKEDFSYLLQERGPQGAPQQCSVIGGYTV